MNMPIAGLLSRTLQPNSKPKFRWRATASGAVVALLLAELCLRPFSGQLNRAGARPLIEDSPNAPILTVRSYEEGIATAHFTPALRRLTGRKPYPDADNVVVLGNSFVEALQVSDVETLGARVEQIADSNGQRINAIQYGWEGAAPPKYALEKENVFALWQPRMVVVVATWDSFAAAALDNSWSKAKVQDGKVVEAALVSDPPANSFRGRWQNIRQISALLETVVRRRTALIPSLRPALPDPESVDPHIAVAFLRFLQQSYGDRLFVIYAAEPGLVIGSGSDRAEDYMLAACSEVGVRCASTGPQAREARDQKRFLVSGFSNTSPGSGHYNAQGHRLIAGLIWSELEQRRKIGTAR